MRRHLGIFVSFVISIVGVIQTEVSGQELPRAEFEAATIKRSPTSKSGAIAIGTQTSPLTLALNGINIRSLTARAYSLNPYQIIGPTWLNEEYYDVVGKSAGPSSNRDVSLMLQSLLADRFGLVAERITRQLPCYELVIGKALKLSAGDASSPPRYFPGNPTAVRASSISMTRLAELLSAKVDRPVLDRTGVDGVYDVDLRWSDDLNGERELGPSLFTAVQDQLGLKLETRGACPVEVLLINHIERSSEN